ncbi:MAG TPA: hypothetical protein VHF58_09250, partial [Solirubrobacterales bacterium]|nr:hypothetical protein [Solirubrobacterales bacterium]
CAEGVVLDRGLAGRQRGVEGRLFDRPGIARPARRAERLVLETLKLVLGSALAPLQIEMLSDRVVENAHGNTLTV